MKTIFNLAATAFIAITTLSSCSKKDDPAPAVKGKAYMEFFNMAGGSSLNLNNQWYKNANGDSFTVSKFNYYISNVVFHGSSGTADYTEANSYHLIEQMATPSEMAFYLNDVPAGNYSSVSFMVGVDSLHNVSGAQSGDLDPAKGNFWSWSSGYIMLKFEGNSPKSPNPDGMLVLHCGGFSGTNNVLRTITLPFPAAIEVSKSAEPHVHVQADILALFAAPNKIDFAATSTIHMPGPDANKLADNYTHMFSISYAGL